jgi:hypothetical protein
LSHQGSTPFHPDHSPDGKEKPNVKHPIWVLILLAAHCAVCSPARADDAAIVPGLTYVCNGERLHIESCNMRDISDSSSCLVAHPDHMRPNGFPTYTNETRGNLRKLLPTCQQPTAQQITAAENFQQRQQAVVDANIKNAQDAVSASQALPSREAVIQAMQPKDPEERQMNRCISAGRLPASCTGNALLGGFSKMITSMLPSVTDSSKPPAGPVMAGVYVGAGNWRLDFVDGGVLVNCSFLAPNQETYSLKFEANRTALIINTTPKPLNLTFHADGTIVGPPGPVTIDGVIPSGSTGGSYTPGHEETQTYTNTERMSAYQVPQNSPNVQNVQSAGGNMYDVTTTHSTSTYVPGQYQPGATTFASKRATCPAVNLTSKGAGVGIQTMETDLLKTAFGGDKGPPTPPGIRMQGIYAASTGFSAQFFPESVILGCGPDAARAYPYAVVAGPVGAVIKIDTQDHPLTLTIRPDNTLDPGSATPYQVHGRLIIGQNDNGNYAFLPNEQTCGLAVLAPSASIPTNGGSTASMSAANTPAAMTLGSAPASNPATLSTPEAPLGNATLAVTSGFAAQLGMPDPLAGRPYLLLRQSYGDTLAKAGVIVPAGVSPYKYAGTACGTGSPDCARIKAAINTGVASAVRADATGKGMFPGVPSGTYYLMISALYNGQPYVWGQAVHLNAGANAITLDLHNAAPLK